MDGADNGTPSIDNIPDCAHDNGSSTGVQACSRGTCSQLRSSGQGRVCLILCCRTYSAGVGRQQSGHKARTVACCAVVPHMLILSAGRGKPGAHKAPYGLLLQHSPDVGSSMNTIEGLATCKGAEAGQTTLSVPSSSCSSL